MVVHAVRGKRKEYQPLESVLSCSADPIEVASTFKAVGFKKLYVADLDNIMGEGRCFPVIKRIAECTELKVMVDAGIADARKALEAFQLGASEIVVGTETLLSLDFVEEAVGLFGSERVIVSLDLLNGKVLSKSEETKSMGAVALVGKFQEMGATRIIVLDLARVGAGEGVDLPLLKQILGHSSVQVFVGGGVRNIQDLEDLKAFGVHGALLATALHSGRITVEELQKADML